MTHSSVYTDRNEQAFFEDESLMHFFLKNAPVALAMFDMDMRYIAFSQHWVDDYHLQDKPLLGQSHYDVFPEISAYWKEIHQRGLRGETIREASEPFVRIDGSVQWLRWEVRPWYNKYDGMGGIVIFSEDISELKQLQKESLLGKVKLEVALESMSDAIFISDDNGNFLHFNEAFATFHRFANKNECAISLKEYPQLLNAYTLSGEKLPLEHWAVPSALRGERGEGVEVVMERTDSGERWIGRYNFAPIHDKQGEIIGSVVTGRDITESKQAEAELRIAATAFESQEGMLVTDAQRRILKVNKAFTDITGYTAAEVVGETPHFLQSGLHDDSFYDDMWRCINTTGAWEGEIYNRRKNGQIYPEHMAITAVKNAAGSVTHYVGSLSDISEQREAVERIQQLAFYDALTGLPNRQLLQDRLQQVMANSGRSGNNGALLFIDIDNFKTLNDTLGHDIGDVLLKQVAERLTSIIREGDTAARFGGDEFVVLLDNVGANRLESAKGVEVKSSQILSLLKEPYVLNGHPFSMTCSIGATLFYDHQPSLDALLKEADIALYQAKAAGRNTLRFFDLQMQIDITERVTLESDLREGISAFQFELYYQPQVDQLEQIIGAEALIRWHHPQRGLVAPGAFISLAEETGLILPIGAWIIDMACRQLQLWQQDSRTAGLTLAINVSAKQYHQPAFVQQVHAALERYEIDPTKLKLELTESILLDNIEDMIIKMGALKVLGVQFSLDDFGTGYSSLQYLKKLPLNQLKIDQSFIRDITQDKSDQAIVRTIIAMAKSLSLEVIAEGVETAEQQKCLRKEACTTYQGYLFGKPMPIKQFMEALSLTASQ